MDKETQKFLTSCKEQFSSAEKIIFFEKLRDLRDKAERLNLEVRRKGRSLIIYRNGISIALITQNKIILFPIDITISHTGGTRYEKLKGGKI